MRYCETCNKETEHRWLYDNENDEEENGGNIYICCECGEEAEGTRSEDDQ